MMLTEPDRRSTGVRFVGEPSDNIGLSSSVHNSIPVKIDEFRLIKLKPARSSHHPIVAELFAAKLGDLSRRYDALSYMWGNANDTTIVAVNNQHLRITKNLETSLRFLRHVSEDVTIWVDSICINQHNKEERMTQVMNMGEIFSYATCVRIWLGEAQQGSSMAMKLLNDCDLLQNEAAIIQRIVEDEPGSLGLAELLLRPYWSRMWMFQEILLARCAYVHCGEFNADWWTFRRLDMVLNWGWKWSGSGNRSEHVYILRKVIFNIAHFLAPSSQSSSIGSVLFPTSRLEASDDRDKLFALMGVCNIGDYLKADYSKTTCETYADFTRCFSQSTGELSLLWAAGLHRPANGPNIGLPSWVPDFRGRSGKDPVFLAAGYSKVFDACAGKRFSEPRNPSRRTSWDSGVLEVEGLLIDQVAMAQPFHANEAGRMEMYRTFEVCSGGRHPSGKSRIEAFLETIIFDTDEPNSGDSDRVIDEKQGRRLQHMLGFMKDLETLQADVVPRKRNGCVDFSVLFGSEVVDHYDGLGRSQPDTLEGHRKVFVKDFKYNVGSTSSFLSTRANYFGRCNDSVQTGDMVALLSGCSFPVVLRKCQSGFEFVGVAYVSGLMYGELMDGVKGSAVQGISLV